MELPEKLEVLRAAAPLQPHQRTRGAGGGVVVWQRHRTLPPREVAALDEGAVPLGACSCRTDASRATTCRTWANLGSCCMAELCERRGVPQ